MTREYWLHNYNAVRKQCDDYDTGKLALTKIELHELWGELSYWKGRCPHADTETGYIHYSCDDTIGSRIRHSYSIVDACKDCEARLNQRYVSKEECKGLKCLNAT